MWIAKQGAVFYWAEIDAYALKTFIPTEPEGINFHDPNMIQPLPFEPIAGHEMDILINSAKAVFYLIVWQSINIHPRRPDNWFRLDLKVF